VKKLATGLYDVSWAKDGGAGARGIRYEGSEVGSRGEGNDCRLDAGELLGDATEAIEAIEEGRDGKSCESLSEAPDVFLRRSGGRA
jgi:hypothetical protein